MDEVALEGWVEETVAPYRNALPPRLLDEMRVMVRATLSSHPVARQLARELAHHAPQLVSGVVADASADPLTEAELRKQGAKK